MVVSDVFNSHHVTDLATPQMTATIRVTYGSRRSYEKKWNLRPLFEADLVWTGPLFFLPSSPLERVLSGGETIFSPGSSPHPLPPQPRAVDRKLHKRISKWLNLRCQYCQLLRIVPANADVEWREYRLVHFSYFGWCMRLFCVLCCPVYR
jgi:hypothetical protein